MERTAPLDDRCPAALPGLDRVAIEREPGERGERTAARSPDVRWDVAGVSRARRRALIGRGGAVVWLTGLPGAGKSTIAGAVEERLLEQGVTAYRLDGDNLRHGLNGDLGFSPADRGENVRRTAHAARLLADAGTVVLVSLVSPIANDRLGARRLCEGWEIPFLEVWVSTPLATCEARDPKGLYARARQGALTGLTGVDDPYEAPREPELELDGRRPVGELVAGLLSALGDGVGS
jgi:adenylyl-sulfate kinase